jgi:CheY-like chemotaxis protein
MIAEDRIADDLTQAHILVVDDELGIREMLSRVLQADGHVVQTVSSGEEALAQFHPGAFDLIITDFSMPGMKGDALAAAVKKMAPAQPILLLTGCVEGVSAPGSKVPNVDLLAGKPFDISDLRLAVLSLLQRPQSSPWPTGLAPLDARIAGSHSASLDASL